MLLIQYTLIYASVLIFVAMGGMFSERSGVINLGLEGIMVMGALGGANRFLSHAHLIRKFELHFADLANTDLNINDILESGRAFVVALDGHYGRENALGLNLVEAVA